MQNSLLMKPIVTVLACLLLICVGITWIGVDELYSENRVLKSDIEGLRIQADSLERVIKLQSDTIRIAKNTIILQADTIKNDKQAKEKYKRNTHDQIKFVSFSNDSLRTTEIKKLYPSWQNQDLK